MAFHWVECNFCLNFCLELFFSFFVSLHCHKEQLSQRSNRNVKQFLPKCGCCCNGNQNRLYLNSSVCFMKFNNYYHHLMGQTDLNLLRVRSSFSLVVHTEEDFAAAVVIERYSWFFWKNQVQHHPKSWASKIWKCPMVIDDLENVSSKGHRWNSQSASP